MGFDGVYLMGCTGIGDRYRGYVGTGLRLTTANIGANMEGHASARAREYYSTEALIMSLILLYMLETRILKREYAGQIPRVANPR